MKRFAAWIVTLFLCIGIGSTGVAAENDDLMNDFSWFIGNDHLLTIHIALADVQDTGWSCTVSDDTVMMICDEGSTADQETEESNNDTGIWYAVVAPVDGAAGLVMLNLVHTGAVSDAPDRMIPMEIYLNGEGEILVLSIGDRVIHELDL